MIIEKCNFEIPSEFNEEFFIKVLENGLQISEVKILKITLTMGSSGGENYCSKIYRIKIEYNHSKSTKMDNEIISIIIKYMSDTLTPKLLDQFYNNEVKIYTKVLPYMENLFNGNLKFGPKFYHQFDNQIPIIVMEDLGSLHYNVADRLIGLNEPQTKLVLKKIAKFHAASMVLVEKNPKIFESFKWFLFEDRKDEIIEEKRKQARDNMFYGNIKHIIREFEKFPEFQPIMEKLKKLTIEKLYEEVNNTLERSNSIKVLNHGDMWVNNVLIRNENEMESNDAVFVDFQLSYFGSLGLDLQYFFNTSVQIEQHRNRDNLIAFYHENLQKTLKSLNFNGVIPTLDDVQKEINACEIVGFMAAEIILLIISIDRDESKDNSFETFLDKDKMFRQFSNVLTKNQRVIEILKTTIKRCDNLKLFDDFK